MILLLNLPSDFRTDFVNFSGIPLRIGCLSKLLTEWGFEHVVLDLNIRSLNCFGVKRHKKFYESINSPKNQFSYLAKSKKQKKRYLNWIWSQIPKSIDFVAVNGDVPWLTLTVLRMFKEKNPDIKTIVGGKRASQEFSQYIMKYVDFIVRGSANPLRQILNKNLDGFTELKHDENKIFISDNNQESEFIKPEYSKIDISSYLKIYNYAPLLSSKGCQRQCNFCNYQSNENILLNLNLKREVEFFRKQGITNFMFLDNAVNITKPHLQKLLKEIMPLRIKWGGGCLE